MKITYYHVSPDQSRYVQYVPYQLNLLVSVYRLQQFKHISRHLSLAKSLMIDSGMISAMKKGQLDWLNNHDLLVEWAQKLEPEYVVALDCPSEPEMLKKIGIDVVQARRRTVENAEKMLYETGLPENTKKVYVVQGWNLSDYEACIDEFRKLGIFDLNPRPLIGIGSVCMRRPNWKRKNPDETPVPDLYEVAQFVRNKIYGDVPLHCFGIGATEWVTQMSKWGITSFDSGTSSWNVARNDGICQIKPMQTWACHSPTGKDRRAAYHITRNLTGKKLRDFDELVECRAIKGMRSGFKIVNRLDQRYTVRFKQSKDNPDINEVTVSLNERVGRELDLQFALEMTAYEKQMMEEINANY